MFEIRQDDLASGPTRELLRIHLAGMHANSPPAAVMALDLTGLHDPAVTVWSVWADDAIAGIGALKSLGDGGGEIKSMRTHPDHLRCGVASALLAHILAEARRRGMTRLSLETGSGPAFEPALSLYRSRGFTDGASFGDYPETDFNRFLHLSLGPER